MKYLVASYLAIATFALTGCTSTIATAETLAGTKSPVQLTRNTVASLIADEAIDIRETTTDESMSCTSDPAGRERAWFSGIRLILVADAAAKAQDIGAGMVVELESAGWSSTEELDEKSSTWNLAKPGLSVDLVVTAVGDPDGNGKGASILVESTGPCVITDGANSAEVRALEGQ